ncbi:MAG: LamG domain-containing protein [Candidatus Omnitrophica bacterium]|nr:LamG domain-containing protein [Candidatus Omnitrophota bacterium]
MKHILLTSILLIISVFGGENYKLGYIQYPVNGNISEEEGTVEMWIKPKKDPYLPAFGKNNSWYSILIFQVVPSKKYGSPGFSFIWSPTLGLNFYGSYLDEEGKSISYKNSPNTENLKPKWNVDEWKHIAVRWKGEEISLFVDGEKLVSRKIDRKLIIDKNGWIIIGRGVHDFVIDEFCISGKARSDEEIRERMKKPLVVDEYTLLLDNFEKFEEKNTVAVTISGFSGEKGGKLDEMIIREDKEKQVPIEKSYEIVEGKFGKGLRFKTIEF